MIIVQNGLDKRHSQPEASSRGLLRLQKTTGAERRAFWNTEERPA